jgi:hypothetical protein
MTAMSAAARCLCLCLCFCLLAGCTWFHAEDRVLITSDPLGASVFVDGTDMHRTTPASLAIGGLFGCDHIVTLKKTGYRPETRRLCQYTEGYTSRWIDGASDFVVPPMPIMWTGGDFVFPFGVRSGMEPQSLHMKLYREDEPRLGFDVLQKKTTAAAPPVSRPGAPQGQSTQ